jgi:anaerobic selenocysteine-containing dehydrogenase
MEEYITACPRNCYSTCTFRVQVKDNVISRILPYQGNLATPEGPCIKGLSYFERANSPDRIIHPLKKKSNGSFEPISYDEALEIISEKLTGIREESGSHSILWYRGSGMSGLTNEIGSEFWKNFGGVTTTYGNLCWPAGLEAVRLTLGTVKHNVPWDLVNAKTIIIWGKNTAETNIQEISFIASAKEKGCKVVVIDPVRTPTADKADILYSIKPGTDAALALALARILVERDLVDHSFIQNYVLGFDEFRSSLNITPAKASVITGIPENKIIALAEILGNGNPLTIIPGYGLQRHHNGGQTIRAILSLILLTGNIGKPGAGFNYANLQSYIYDDPKEPVCYYPDPVKDIPFRRTVSMARLGACMLTNEPELKAAWIERGNPIIQSPDSANVRKAFNKLKFKVVVDEFLTDTAKEADIILPAKNMFEQSDIIGSYWSPFLQFKPKILDAPAEVLPESEIYYFLSKKIGLDTENIPQPGNENIEKWLEQRIKGYSAITLEDLRKAPVIPPSLQEIAYEDYKFETPSGKAELYSLNAGKLWGVSPLPAYVADEKKNPEFNLLLLTPNMGGRIHSQFGNLEIIRNSFNEPGARISPVEAEKRNIKNGSKIRIYNENGSVITSAIISARIPEGTIVFPNGIWLNEGGGGNELIRAKETDMGYGAAFHDTMVETEVCSE